MIHFVVYKNEHSSPTGTSPSEVHPRICVCLRLFAVSNDNISEDICHEMKGIFYYLS